MTAVILKWPVRRSANARNAGLVSGAKRRGDDVSNALTNCQRVEHSQISTAKAVGLSNGTYYKSRKIVEAAEADPAAFGGRSCAATLARMRGASVAARRTGAWSPDLEMLAYLTRTARPGAKSIRWEGIRYPLAAGLAGRYALDPQSLQPLLGVVL